MVDISKNYIAKNNKALLYVPNIENVGGFIFDIPGSTQHTLESDITDHYVEDNTAIQDHWALKPESIVLKNYQGELVMIQQSFPIVKNTVSIKLSVNATIVPSVLPQTQQNRNNINNIQNNNININTAINNLAGQFYGIQNSIGATRQQKAYQFFKTIRANRILISIVTPYGTFDNIAIGNIVPFQDEDSKYLSTFTLTLKEIRFAGYQTVSFNPNAYQGNAATQNAPLVTHRAQGKQVTSPSASIALAGLQLINNTQVNNPLLGNAMKALFPLQALY
jgi:hypothetical protein